MLCKFSLGKLETFSVCQLYFGCDTYNSLLWQMQSIVQASRGCVPAGDMYRQWMCTIRGCVPAEDVYRQWMCIAGDVFWYGICTGRGCTVYSRGCVSAGMCIFRDVYWLCDVYRLRCVSAGMCI